MLTVATDKTLDKKWNPNKKGVWTGSLYQEETSMCARGMSRRDIADTIEDIYGFSQFELKESNEKGAFPNAEVVIKAFYRRIVETV